MTYGVIIKVYYWHLLFPLGDLDCLMVVGVLLNKCTSNQSQYKQDHYTFTCYDVNSFLEILLVRLMA